MISVLLLYFSGLCYRDAASLHHKQLFLFKTNSPLSMMTTILPPGYRNIPKYRQISEHEISIRTAIRNKDFMKAGAEMAKLNDTSLSNGRSVVYVVCEVTIYWIIYNKLILFLRPVESQALLIMSYHYWILYELLWYARKMILCRP